MSNKILKDKLKQLTDEEQAQVLQFVESVLMKKHGLPEHKPKFGWAGGLSHLKDKYSSVELQKKINEWW